MRALSAVLLLGLLSGCASSSAALATPATTDAPSTATPAATPGVLPSSSDPVDLTSVDACTLLDEATVHQLTGESVRFSTDDLSWGSEIGCFWGAAVPNVSAYVELTVAPRSGGLSSYNFPAGCEVSPVTGVGTEAKGAMCPGDPHLKVRLVVYEQGVFITLLVNDPNRPLDPDDMAATLETVLAELQ
jgi:hypothetical protein